MTAVLNPQALAPTQTAADAHLQQSNQTLAAVKSVAIDSQARVDWAADVIQQLAAQHKAMKKECESVAKPLRDAARKVSAWWKPGLVATKDAIDHLKRGIQLYRDEQARQAQAALAVCTGPEEIQRAQDAILTVPRGLSQRDDFSWIVVDAELIPREYWVIDRAAIDRAVKALGDRTSIPGIEVHRGTKLVRTGK